MVKVIKLAHGVLLFQLLTVSFTQQCEGNLQIGIGTIPSALDCSVRPGACEAVETLYESFGVESNITGQVSQAEFIPDGFTARSRSEWLTPFEGVTSQSHTGVTSLERSYLNGQVDVLVPLSRENTVSPEIIANAETIFEIRTQGGPIVPIVCGGRCACLSEEGRLELEQRLTEAYMRLFRPN